MDLLTALKTVISQNKLLGLVPSNRIMVSYKHNTATLVVGWVGQNGQAMMRNDGANAATAHHTIEFDRDKLPKGVSAQEWAAWPDSVVKLDSTPSKQELLDAARLVGKAAVEFGRTDTGEIIFARLVD